MRVRAGHRRRAAPAKRQHLVELAEQAGSAFPKLRAVGVDIAVRQGREIDVVYDIGPFGARLPGALGLEGTAGEGKDVAAATVHMWLEGSQDPV